MRAALALLSLALVLPGCASPEAADDTTPASASATPATSPSSPSASPAAPASPSPPSSPSPSPPPPASSPSEQVFRGIVLDETHDFSTDGRKVRTFNVTGAEQKVIIDIQSAGPPSDGSFTSAVVHFYYPNTTSPFLAELSGQQASEYTIERGPFQGMWKIVFDGAGKTSAHIRVTLA